MNDWENMEEDHVQYLTNEDLQKLNVKLLYDLENFDKDQVLVEELIVEEYESEFKKGISRE